jgi:hypothetical protein
MTCYFRPSQYFKFVLQSLDHSIVNLDRSFDQSELHVYLENLFYEQEL